MLNWETVATFSLSQGKENNLGFAGMFAGNQDDLVILAGGANFPNGMPWEGGNKKWYDTVYLLKRKNGGYEWVPTGNVRLPMPMAYGASVSKGWCHFNRW